MKIKTLLGIVGACWAISTSASEITYTLNGTVPGGYQVKAEADFTTAQDHLTIILRNLQVDPSCVNQCISGLTFSLGSGLTGGTLASSSGLERTINSNGTFTDGTVKPSGWIFTGSSLYLNDLAGKDAAGPAHTLIGDPGAGGVYHGNNSITGNGAHNPFLYGALTFDLNIPGLLATDNVTGMQFQFGTSSCLATVNGTVPDGGTSVLLLGMALSGLGLVSRKFV